MTLGDEDKSAENDEVEVIDVDEVSKGEAEIEVVKVVQANGVEALEGSMRSSPDDDALLLGITPSAAAPKPHQDTLLVPSSILLPTKDEASHTTSIRTIEPFAAY